MNESPSIIDFEQWLSQKVKPNGDKLLPSTIERYVYLTEPFFSLGERMREHETLLALAQKITAGNNVMYFAVKNLMEFLQYPEEVVVKYKAPRSRAKAATSRRFLQSLIMSRQELKRVFNEVQDPTLNLAIHVLYDTACRREELLSIKWKDIYWKKTSVDEDKPFIAQGIHAEIRIRGKGNKVRTVYFGPETAKRIKLAHLKEPWEQDDYLIRFISRNTGEPVKEQANKLYKLMVKEVDRVLSRHLSPHSLRHTRATHMADAGADILDIAAYLGHASVQTTQIYVEISSFRARQAFARYSADL